MFESHITVTGLNVEEFQADCRHLGVKPIVITDDGGSSWPVQMMTGKFHKTTSQDEALAAMHAVADHFGPRVVRRKLEKILGPRAAIPTHLYQEYHLKYEVPRDRIDRFKALVEGAGGRTARNSFKPSENPDKVYIFATTRSEESYNELAMALTWFDRRQTIRECVVYDDHQEMDDRWSGPCDECGLKVFDQETTDGSRKGR